MKKLVTPLFALFVTAVSAQITITKNDMPAANDTFRISQGNIIGIPDPTLTGANYTWDYSSLIPTIQNKDTFLSVSATPFAYQFYFNNVILYPNWKATVAHSYPDFTAIPQVQLTDIANFYKAITAEYTQVGFGANINGIPASVRFDSLDVIYRFPMNYNNKDSCISKYLLSVPTFGAYGQRKKRVNHVEGWGTVITPYGSFQCLKVKSALYATDTIYVSQFSFGFNTPLPVQYEYKWLASGKKIPILQINTIGTTITSVAYYDSIRPVAQVGIHEDILDAIAFSAYPNPVNDQLNISYSLQKPCVVKIELLDMLGQTVSNFVDQQQREGGHSYVLNMSAIEGKGFYFLKTSVDEKVAIRKIILQ